MYPHNTIYFNELNSHQTNFKRLNQTQRLSFNPDSFLTSITDSELVHPPQNSSGISSLRTSIGLQSKTLSLKKIGYKLPLEKNGFHSLKLCNQPLTPKFISETNVAILSMDLTPSNKTGHNCPIKTQRLCPHPSEQDTADKKFQFKPQSKSHNQDLSANFTTKTEATISLKPKPFDFSAYCQTSSSKNIRRRSSQAREVSKLAGRHKSLKPQRSKGKFRINSSNQKGCKRSILRDSGIDLLTFFQQRSVRQCREATEKTLSANQKRKARENACDQTASLLEKSDQLRVESPPQIPTELINCLENKAHSSRFIQKKSSFALRKPTKLTKFSHIQSSELKKTEISKRRKFSIKKIKKQAHRKFHSLSHTKEHNFIPKAKPLEREPTNNSSCLLKSTNPSEADISFDCVHQEPTFLPTIQILTTINSFSSNSASVSSSPSQKDKRLKNESEIVQKQTNVPPQEGLFAKQAYISSQNVNITAQTGQSPPSQTQKQSDNKKGTPEFKPL